ARHQRFVADAVAFLDVWMNRVARAAVEVRAGEPILDVQIARFASRGVYAVPVVQAVGDVGRLLHFEEQDVGADGVDCARLEEEAVAGAGREAVQGVRDSLRLQSRAEIAGGDAVAEAGVDAARGRVRLQHYPGFSLAICA